MEKIKTYVLTLSKFFPSTHIRKGEPTSFRDYMKERSRTDLYN